MPGPHLSVQSFANCLQQLVRLGGFMACDDLCWTDSQIGTCDDLYKRQQQAVTYKWNEWNSVTYRGTESKVIIYNEPRASRHLQGDVIN